ncbi:MAG TPA: four helix bundle protein [Planctomycetota bacterium]|nr:four helix bundle protein [Planctomycetota bacterium]
MGESRHQPSAGAGGKTPPRDLKIRTRQFALLIVHTFTALPRDPLGHTLGTQILHSGTSVGAHYHEATHSRSDAEYISKLELALQELEETWYWCNLLSDSSLILPQEHATLITEISELKAILIACTRKAKRKS